MAGTAIQAPMGSSGTLRNHPSTSTGQLRSVEEGVEEDGLLPWGQQGGRKRPSGPTWILISSAWNTGCASRRTVHPKLSRWNLVHNLGLAEISSENGNHLPHSP